MESGVWSLRWGLELWLQGSTGQPDASWFFWSWWTCRWSQRITNLTLRPSHNMPCTRKTSFAAYCSMQRGTTTCTSTAARHKCLVGNACTGVQTQHTDEDRQTVRHVYPLLYSCTTTHTHTHTPRAKLYQSKTRTLHTNTSHTETQAYTKAIKHICTQTTLKPAAATLVYLAGLEKCVSSAAYRCGPEQLDEYFTPALCNGNTGTRSCSSRPFWCSSPRSGSRCDKQLGKR